MTAQDMTTQAVEKARPRGFYITEARFMGEKCKVKINTLIPTKLGFVIEWGRIPKQVGLYIDNPAKTFLPKLREMFPSWFTYNREVLTEEVSNLFDQVDAVVREGQLTGEDDEAYKQGYMDALELMQTEMNAIEKKLRNGEKQE